MISHAGIPCFRLTHLWQGHAKSGDLGCIKIPPREAFSRDEKCKCGVRSCSYITPAGGGKNSSASSDFHRYFGAATLCSFFALKAAPIVVLITTCLSLTVNATSESYINNTRSRNDILIYFNMQLSWKNGRIINNSTIYRYAVYVNKAQYYFIKSS